MLRIINHFSVFAYRYLTAFIVIASPLFFIPGLSIAPEDTYYVTIAIAAVLALAAYMITALTSSSWHSLTRVELIGYSVFSVAVVLSAAFSRDPKSILFGNDINPFAVSGLLLLPVVVYLVRTLPTTFRNRLKLILLAEVVISALVFAVSYMYQGSVHGILVSLFGGFSSSLSFALYLGLFVIGGVAFLRRDVYARHHKAAVAMTMFIVAALAILVATQGDIRPNLPSSFIVAKEVLINNGPFGIGAGDFTRAWQLYRPQAVVNTPYFDLEFIQGSGTFTTFLSTIGLIGTGAILFLVVVGILVSYTLWKREQNKEERTTLLLLLATQVYFLVLGWVVPMSFALIVLWMAVLGFVFSKVRTDEHSPNKSAVFLFVPILALLLVNSLLLIKKVEGQHYFALAKSASATGDAAGATKYLDQALSYYQNDTYYRGKAELAIQSAQRLVSTPGTDQEALKNQYLAFAKQAVDASLLAIQTSPYNYQNYVTSGKSYELAIPFDKDAALAHAKDAYNKAIALYPGNPYLYLIQARLSASVGEKEGVRTSLTEALKKKENFADALYLMSQLSASEQKADEALQYALGAVQSAPNDPQVWVQAGLLFYGKQDYQNAVIALQKAFSLDQSNGTIAYFLALSLRDGGRPDLAKVIGQELLKQNPNNVDVSSLLKSLETAAPQASTKKK